MSEEMMESLVLAGRPDVDALAITRAPALVLEEARKAAVALTDVIEKKAKKLQFNGQTYLQFEDWQTLGRFYGVTAIVTSSKFVEYGEVRGFEAVADALLVATNQRISSAEAMCLDDEPKWGSRPKYDYQDIMVDGKKQWDDTKKKYKSKRVLIGEEAVPLFQLKSMAQTRACAKALRNVLAWVVVLAGYAPTPAEEMEDHTKEKIEAAEDNYLSKIGQVRSSPKLVEAFWAMFKTSGKTPEQLATILRTRYSANSPEELTSEELSELVKWAASKEPIQTTLETSVAAVQGARERTLDTSVAQTATAPLNTPQKGSISARQISRLFAIAREHNKPEADIRQYVKERYGLESLTDLTRLQYDHVVNWTESVL